MSWRPLPPLALGTLLAMALFSSPAMGQRPGGLYGLDAESTLFLVDPQDGALTPIGDVGFTECGALTFFGPQVLAVCRSGTGELILVDIDPESGAGSELGALDMGGAGEDEILDLTVDGEDRLLALSAPQGLLWALDPTTGRATLVATYVGENPVETLAFIRGGLFAAGEGGLSEVVSGYGSKAKREWDHGIPMSLTGIPGSEALMALVEDLDGVRLAQVQSEWGTFEVVAETSLDLWAIAFHDPQRTPRPRADAGEGDAQAGFDSPAEGVGVGGGKVGSAPGGPPSVSGPGTVTGSLEVRVDLRRRLATWELTVTNNGPEKQHDNPGDEIFMPPPAPGTALHGNGVSMHVQEGSISWNGELDVGESVVLVLQSPLPKLEPGLRLATQAVLLYDGDGDGVNESRGLSDDPEVSGDVDATVWEVPSAGGMALRLAAGTVLALLLGALILWGARRLDRSQL